MKMQVVSNVMPCGLVNSYSYIYDLIQLLFASVVSIRTARPFAHGV